MEDKLSTLASGQANYGTARGAAVPRVVARQLSDRWFVGLTIGLVLILTSLPFVYAYLSTPPERQFMGIMLDVPDHGQYFSWMRELTNANLASNKLTPEPNAAIFFNLLWWGMGRLGALLGLGYAGMFQVLRVVSAVLFLLLMWRVMGLFFQDPLQRRTAFLIATFTSGLGWVLIVLKYTLAHGELLLPLDVFIAEGNTFLSILGYPHFIAAALYIFVFDLVLRGQERGQLRYSVAAGLVALFLGWQHAYDLISVYGVLGAYGVLLALRGRRVPVFIVKSIVIVGLISWWPAIYSVILTRADPVWREVLRQFANAGVYTPGLLELPLLLGLSFLLALYTAIRDNPARLSGVSDRALFVRGWFWVTFLLVYLPVDFQIHLINGWQAPIAILATIGLFRYVAPALDRLARARLSWSRETLQRALVVIAIVAILPTNVYLWSWRFTDLARHDYPFYLHSDDVAALNWLNKNARPSDVVLSSVTIGQYIPAWTGTNAFLAHWAQTLRFYDKSRMVQAFFDPATNDDERRQIVQQYHVDYIYYGPAEKALGTYTPDSSSFLALAFSSPEVKVYAVQNGAK